MPSSAPIMTLAPELHLTIAGMLDCPNNVMLKLASRYFYKLTKPLVFEELLAGWQCELEILGEVLPCIDCHRLRPNAEFECGEMHNRQWSCIECKVQREREDYRVGDKIRVGRGHVLCRQCDEFTGDIPCRVIGLCERCWKCFDGQGYRFCSCEPGSPEDFMEEQSSNIKTRGGWLHHDIWCTNCSELFARCQWARAQISQQLTHPDGISRRYRPWILRSKSIIAMQFPSS